MPRTQVVQELMGLLNAKSELKVALREAVELADRPTIREVKDFCDYVDGLVQLVPRSSQALVSLDLAFYYIIGQSQVLRENCFFQGWMVEVAKTWAEFLDSPASLQHLQSFKDTPLYRIDDYYEDASGWRSFNQFFARHVKAGRRRICNPQDEGCVVFPADSEMCDMAKIDENAEVQIKGVTISLEELLQTSQYNDAFAGGHFCHVLLQAWDYHRVHTPLGGKVIEADNIPGNVWLDVIEENGELKAIPAPGFQVQQGRARVVLETSRGLVAVLPVGMGHISSVTLTTEKDAVLPKGAELGYFQFGGSDVVLLFESPNVKFVPKTGEHADQGRHLAQIT